MLTRFINFLLSVRFATILILVFASVIGYATFIENDFGRSTAKALIYNKWWFEIILVILVANLITNLKRYNLFRKEKLAVLIFHLAFIIIIIGAGITRYFSFEGMMHIREGQSSNVIISDNVFLQVKVDNRELQYEYDKPLFLSGLTKSSFSLPIQFLDNDIKIVGKQFLPNVIDTFEIGSGGVTRIHLVVPGPNGMKSEYLKDKQQRKIGDHIFTFNNPAVGAINIQQKDDSLICNTSFSVSSMKMINRSTLNYLPNQSFNLTNKTLYKVESLNFVLKDVISESKDKLISSSNVMKDGNNDALIIDVFCNDEYKEVTLIGGKGFNGIKESFMLGGLYFNLNYGSKNYYTPFNVFLRDFELERYPGSDSPSSFAAEVTVIDGSENKDYRIFMNNVLDYRGYRFFQSSYDKDEQGTILSVNHDKWGTFVSYFGYSLLALGMVFVFFSSSTRYKFLSKQLNNLKKRTLVLIACLFSVQTVSANTIEHDTLYSSVIDNNHTLVFEQLLIQDNGGRIKPVHTLCSQFLRKITRKNSLNGQSPTQVILGMMNNPQFWSKVPMIKVSHENVKELLDTDSSRVSFQSFFSKDGSYKLKELVDRAYAELPANRGKFEKDIIAVDERVNICFTVYNGGIFRLFPLKDDINNKWFSSMQNHKFSGPDSLFVANIMPLYFSTLKEALLTNNWNSADSVVKYIHKFQYRYGKNVIPNQYKINLEVVYNKLNIFAKLFIYYSCTGLLFLILLFVQIFTNKRYLNYFIKIIKWSIILGLLMHTAGLIARWIISDHAPWSNGYESMIYTAWATMLSGIIFSKRSNLTLAATALVSSMILMFAHLNWMDPEITNLVPVLNSYWLMIHVAIIVASYGFLLLGAVLALLNLWVIIFTSNKTKDKLQNVTKELTLINERSLTVGLFMLTIGTFLGGVWANESWGRYWGWDPKETWALVTILVYVFILHMRLIPSLKDIFTFNLASLIGIWSVMMTYFGVNYYLSGLHSYAAGDPMPIPDFVYYFLGLTIVTAVLSRIKYKKYY